MAQVSTSYAVRDCAAEIIEALKRAGGDAASVTAGLREPMRKLMARPDLLTLGVPRQGNNVAVSYYLYFDGRMSILLYQVPKGKAIQPHDHGIWESVFVYRGRLKHTVYERIDNGAEPGVAELRAIDDRILERGDCAVVAPPADIHGFSALADETWGITVVDGAYKADRHYYQPEEKTYLIKAQANAR